MNKQLKQDYKQCEDIIKKASKSFYQAFSTLKDKDQRYAVYAVYAYCRYSDDIADDMKSQKALYMLKQELDAFVKERTQPNYIFRALDDVARKFYPKDFDFKPYYDMLAGHQMDFDDTQYHSLASLYDYSKLVASSVGEMLIYILAPKQDVTILKQVAQDLGIAMQLTNILRDVGEDDDQGRLYLPSQIMDKHGLTKEMIADKVVNDAFIAVFDELAEIANTHYDKALHHLKDFPLETRKSLHYAAVIYREILSVCKAEKYDVLTKRNKVSSLRKWALIEEVNKLYVS